LWLRADENDQLVVVVKATLDEIVTNNVTLLENKVGGEMAIRIADWSIIGHLGNELYIQLKCELSEFPDPSFWTSEECQRFLDHKLGIDCNMLNIAADDVEAWRVEVANRLDEADDE
jgi:hypothetical protein